MKAIAEWELIDSHDRAQNMLQPLRSRILTLAREPRSATEMATILEMPRQKVNYHVQALSKAKLLRKAGRRRRRNMYEQRFLASAKAYVLSPEILGAAGLTRAQAADRFSASFLIAQSTELQRDLSFALAEASYEEKRLATLSMSADIRFQTKDQREQFAAALKTAITQVIADHTTPARQHDGSPGAGAPYRLFVGCYPTPRNVTRTKESR